MWAAAVLPSMTTDFTGILHLPENVEHEQSVTRLLPLQADREARGHTLSFSALRRALQFRLRDHLDGVARALFEARRAPGTEVEIDPVEPPLPQLDDRLLGTRRQTVVTFEAVPAGKTARRLEARFALGETGDDLIEARAFLDRQLGVLAPF